MLYNSPNQFRKSQIVVKDMRKAKKMAIGTVSRGRKKIAEGKWIPVKSSKSKQTTKVYSNAQMKNEMLKLDEKHKEEGFLVSANNISETILNPEQSRKYKKYLDKGSHPKIRSLIKQGRGNDWAKILTLDAYLVFGDNLNVRIPKNEWKDFGIGNMDSISKSITDNREVNSMGKQQIIVKSSTMQKARKMAIGTESKGRKKVAEGKWVAIGKGKKGGEATGFNKLPKKGIDVKKETLKELLLELVEMPLSSLEKMQDKLRSYVNPGGKNTEKDPENFERRHMALNLIEDAKKIVGAKNPAWKKHELSLVDDKVHELWRYHGRG